MMCNKLVIFTCFVVVVGLGSGVSGQDYNTWFTDADPANSRWDNVGNWSNGLPNYNLQEGCQAVMDYNDMTILIDSATTASAYNIYQGFNPGTSGYPVVQMTGGTLDVFGNYYLGTYQIDKTAGLLMEGGVMTIDIHLILGWQANGRVDMTGGTIDIGDTLWANSAGGGGDPDGTGKVYLYGGTITCADVNLAGNPTTSFVDIWEGTLKIAGDKRDIVDTYDAAGLLKAYGGSGTVERFYNSLDDVTVVTAIPEPATLALLGLGGLALIRRKR